MIGLLVGVFIGIVLGVAVLGALLVKAGTALTSMDDDPIQPW